MDDLQLKQFLRDSLADNQLSPNEREALRNLCLTNEQVHFMRNCAFDLVYEKLSSDITTNRNLVKWLECVVKTLDTTHSPKPFMANAYFSPGDACASQIKSQLDLAQKSIDICVYTIADDHISDAIVNATKRGIVVRIITDDEKMLDDGNDVEYLIKCGIPTKVDRSASYMHHKFAIFDGKILLNGSFNWTRSASRCNQENITITDNETLVKAYQNVFNGLWQQFKFK